MRLRSTFSFISFISSSMVKSMYLLKTKGFIISMNASPSAASPATGRPFIIAALSHETPQLS